MCRYMFLHMRVIVCTGVEILSFSGALLFLVFHHPMKSEKPTCHPRISASGYSRKPLKLCPFAPRLPTTSLVLPWRRTRQCRGCCWSRNTTVLPVSASKLEVYE